MGDREHFAYFNYFSKVHTPAETYQLWLHPQVKGSWKSIVGRDIKNMLFRRLEAALSSFSEPELTFQSIHGLAARAAPTRASGRSTTTAFWRTKCTSSPSGKWDSSLSRETRPFNSKGRHDAREDRAHRSLARSLAEPQM